MIRSFRDAETEKIFQQQFSKQHQAIEKTAIRKLFQLNRATTLRDLAAIPGNQLEALKGDRKPHAQIDTAAPSGRNHTGRHFETPWHER